MSGNKVNRLCDDESSFRDYVERLIKSEDQCVGMDIETNGWDFAQDSVAGFSLSSHVLQEAVYVPLNHEGQNVVFSSIQKDLQYIISNREMIFHGSVYDMQFLCKYGIVFDVIKDSYIIANMLQARQGSLKDLVLEYGIVNFKDVISYIDLIREVFELDDAVIKKLQKKDDEEMKKKYSFGKINLKEYPKAIDYACNDAVWAEALYKLMMLDLRQRFSGIDLDVINPITEPVTTPVATPLINPFTNTFM